MKTEKSKKLPNSDIKNTRLIYRFLDDMTAFMSGDNVKNEDKYNDIKIGLNILIEISAKPGPREEMSLIASRMPEIRAIVIEKSPDFMNDSKLLYEIDENFENFFAEDQYTEETDDFNQFFNFIKEKEKMIKNDMTFVKKLTEINRYAMNRYK